MIFYKGSVIGLIIVFFLFNILLLYFRGGGLLDRYKRSVLFLSSSKVFFLLLIMGLIGLQQGDYWHYAEDIKEIAKTSMTYGRVTHMEPIYEDLARIVKGNYLLWRFVVFGGQFFILIFYLKKLGMLNSCFLYIFTFLCLRGMIVGRASWGIILFFCSVVYAIEYKEKKHFLVSLLCVLSHSSSIVLLATLPLVFFKINKKNIVLFYLIFLGLSGLIAYLFDNIPFLAQYEQTELISQKMESYSNENRENSIGFWGNSLGAKLMLFPLRVGAVILLLWLLIRCYKYREQISNSLPFLLLSCVFLIMFSMVMLMGNFGAGTLSYRFFDMIYFPLSIALYYSFEYSLMFRDKYYRFIEYLFIFSLEVSLLVPIYYL